MKKLRDLKYKGVGIFEQIQKTTPLKIFTETDLKPKTIDDLLYFKYGNRDLNESTRNVELNQDTFDSLCNMVSLYYKHKWDNMTNLILEEVTPTDYEITTRETIDTTGNTTGTNNQDTTNTETETTTGYNSDEFENDNKTDSTNQVKGETAGTNKENVIRELKTTGIKQNKYTLINSSIEYLKQNIIDDIMLIDILNTFTLSLNI